jgi:hypothetical protein
MAKLCRGNNRTQMIEKLVKFQNQKPELKAKGQYVLLTKNNFKKVSFNTLCRWFVYYAERYDIHPGIKDLEKEKKELIEAKSQLILKFI